RLVFGSDNRLLVPLCGFFGAVFLVWSDTLARTILMHGSYQTQLHVGVITALIGGPVFVYLLKKSMNK
ncbi:MAG: iron chelate uptake ABC transporter family permease subunit, partial [Deltaproteobacteria bacterium]|nr:iron chelate uptake ABC transporter family permease subunit [Deltaproteobacteria bacterium]